MRGKRMKETVKIEEVREGDIVNGKEVVEVLHRLHASYVRLILKGGREIIDGYEGKMVEVERRR